MGKKSGKRGSRTFKFSEPDVERKPPTTTNPAAQPEMETVSVSLKHFRAKTECFSDWQQRELKKFSATLDKLRGYVLSDLQKNLSLCDMHKGAPNAARFRRPESLSKDLSFYEIKVDPSNKLRMHGAFIDSTFYLVWLDREHAVFKS